MQIYLFLNAVLYLVFAGWCTFAPSSTADKLGYVDLSNGGHSEYLVIYGGLQLGLALMFAAFSRDPNAWRLGILVSIALYLPIVIYRGITIAKYWPVSSLTLATGGLEAALLIAAFVLYFRVT